MANSAVTNSADLLSMVVFLVSGALISYLAEAAYRAQARAHKAEEHSRLAAEREKAAVELQQSESKYRELVQNANSAVIRWKRDGTLTFFNEYAQKFFGYSAEEVVGKSVNILVPEQESTGGDLTALFQSIVNHPERYASDINENILRDGSRVWMAWTNRPVLDQDGQVLEILAVGSDITERKRAEEGLRKSRDELELRVRERTAELSTANENLREQAALLDLAHDAILVRDMDNNILYWNDGAEKTYGWTKEEALGKDASMLLHTHFPKPLEELMADLLRNGEWEGELGHITKSGQQIMAASRWAIQKSTEGNPIGMLEINRDISERKKAEEQAKFYMAKLEQSNLALQDFAYIAAHDMKEPLRKVMSFGNLLSQKYKDSLAQTGNDYLNRMLHATERMQSLLMGLLDYSRVATAAEPFKEVDLSGLIGEIISDLEVRIVKTGGEVHVGDLPVVSADPTQMRQLFQNLIGNALKFHKPGEKPIVQVRCVSHTGSGSQIVVEDDGIGFDEQHLGKIFAPFQRLHGRSEYEGTGMGLAICKKIVERHGGSITARSAPGAGSTFSVMLPQGHATAPRGSSTSQE